VHLARTPSDLDDVDAPLESSRDPLVLDGAVAASDRLDVIATYPSGITSPLPA
jgi:hypothetical protein